MPSIHMRGKRFYIRTSQEKKLKLQEWCTLFAFLQRKIRKEKGDLLYVILKKEIEYL
mgnify:CR=1 FL=1